MAVQTTRNVVDGWGLGVDGCRLGIDYCELNCEPFIKLEINNQERLG